MSKATRRDGVENRQGSNLNRRSVLLAGAFAAAVVGAGRAHSAIPTGSGEYAVAEDRHRIYFERHGRSEGVPIVLLHGGVMSIDQAFAADLLPRFARVRPVIAIEQQGHGHTADRTGPITYDRMITDTMSVLDHLRVPQADILGHSMGAVTATGMAIRHPTRVRRLIALSVHYRVDGMLPELLELNRNPQHQPSAELASLLPRPEHFGEWAAHYARVAPDPTAFERVLGKLQRLTTEWTGWTDPELQSIRAPTLLVNGDRDFYLPQHLAQMARLIPGARYAVLPGTTHGSILERGEWVASMMAARHPERSPAGAAEGGGDGVDAPTGLQRNLPRSLRAL